MEMNDIEITQHQKTPVNIFNIVESSVSVGMQQTTYDISPDGGTTRVGACEVKFLPRSVTEQTKVKLTLSVDKSRAPDGHIRASVTLTSNPAIKVRKQVHIQLPTWFITKKPVDVSIFSKRNGEWAEIDPVALTDEKFIDIQVKEFTNVTAFLPKNFLSDVSIRVKSYLYHNSNGKFKAAFVPSNEIIDTILTADMRSEKHVPIIANMKELTVTIGDEIRYILSEGDKGEKTPSGKLMKGKIIVDEAFVDQFKGQVSTFDLKATPIHSSYTVTHSRVVAERTEVITEEDYPVVIQTITGPTRHCSVDFLGSFQADNMLTSVQDVHIDQRTIVEDTKGASGRQKMDGLSYDRKMFQVGATGNRKPQATAGLTMTTGGSAGNISSKIRFLGNVKVKNMIGNAGNVTIDQRKIIKKPGTDKPPMTNAIPVDTDVPFGVQQDSGNDTQTGKNDLDLMEKNEIESMARSGRAFASTQQGDEPSNEME